MNEIIQFYRIIPFFWMMNEKYEGLIHATKNNLSLSLLNQVVFQFAFPHLKC